LYIHILVKMPSKEWPLSYSNDTIIHPNSSDHSVVSVS
jgi:hypothetical protein